MNVEYFELKNNYWIARWLKKPSTKIIFISQQDIIKNNRNINIGVGDSIITKIISYYESEKSIHNNFGSINSDFEIIASKLSLPKPLIILVLQNKCNIAKNKRIKQ